MFSGITREVKRLFSHSLIQLSYFTVAARGHPVLPISLALAFYSMKKTPYPGGQGLVISCVS